MSYKILINSFKIYSILLLFLFFGFVVTTNQSVNANSASFFVSGGGNVQPGQQFTVNVSVTGGANYNAVSASVAYSNLTLVSATVLGGWVPVSGPNLANPVTFSGGLLGSVASGSKEVLSITFQAPSSGSGSVTPSGSIALPDENGREVAGGGNTATFTVVVPTQAPKKPIQNTPPQKPVPSAITISSSTHPDSNLWYKEKEIKISLAEGGEVNDFSYVLSQNSVEEVDDAPETKEREIALSVENDGIYFFHVKGLNEIGAGPTSTFQIRIDTSSPNPFAVVIEKNPEGKLILYTSTNDSGSGTVKFRIILDGKDLGFQTTGFILPEDALEKFDSLEVIAVDEAGNEKVGLVTKEVLGEDIVKEIEANEVKPTEKQEQLDLPVVEEVDNNSVVLSPLQIGLISGGVILVLLGIGALIFLYKKGFFEGMFGSKDKNNSYKSGVFTNESPFKSAGTLSQNDNLSTPTSPFK